MSRVDEIRHEVVQAIEARRSAIEADPTLTTITLVVKLNRSPRPFVVYRTESTEQVPEVVDSASATG